MEHYTWDEMDKEILSPTIARKIITGEKAMVAQVFLAKGAVVPEHKHESEQITYILEGALLFEIDGKEIVVGKGRCCRSRRGSRTRLSRWKTHWISTSLAPSARTG
jgi:mannose-6-phosphate isomerase-like protein (cupin superfamily)